jgi:hypothetical protein
MLAECGLHADGIARSINKKLKELFNELAIAVG